MVTQTILRGVVRGKTIELEDATGLSEGQQVVIAVQTLDAQKPHVPGDGILRSAGAWVDAGEEFDEWLEWNRQQRKLSRPEIEP